MEPFVIIFIIAFIISGFLIKSGSDLKKTKLESISRLELINQMNNSKEQNDGFCFQNVERPIIPYEKKSVFLYETDNIDLLINKKFIL